MSVTSATDPVDTVIDLLKNESASGWTNSIPDRIERAEISEPQEKLRGSRIDQVSLYVWSPIEGELDKWSAEGGTDQTETVRVDIMTQDATTSNTYATDVVDILKQYVNDNNSQTEWVDIWPDQIDDQTIENYQTLSVAPVSVFVTLRDFVSEP